MYTHQSTAIVEESAPFAGAYRPAHLNRRQHEDPADRTKPRLRAADHNFPNLPRQLTSFVGRAEEVVEIRKRLLDPACRLLTLVGPGGIGKTRLALQVAAQIADRFEDGVYFVSLQGVTEREGIIAAVAEGIGLALSAQGSTEDLLLEQLVGRNLLLVLDNVEQLMAEVPLITAFLQRADHVQLLVTSREVLNLQEEWLYPVHGLKLPDQCGNDLENCDSIRLFVERARRVYPHFSLEENQAAVVRICHLVEGMPLAIELAASWIRNLDCETIAAHIATLPSGSRLQGERNLGFLTTRLRNVPERHRSIQGVFDHTWALLSTSEQETFKQLSVFRGGFRWEAARTVAGASLYVLTSLVDKSLLRVDAHGRYHIHELLRQYGQERLNEEADAEARVCTRHCAYYMEFLDRRAEPLAGSQQLEKIQEITAELDNIRAAWRWAIEQELIDDLQQGCDALHTFFDFQGRFREALELFEPALHMLERYTAGARRDEAMANICVFLGWSYIRTGQLEEAGASFARSQTLLHSLPNPPLLRWGEDPLPGSALVAMIRGDYREALRLAEEARHRCQARDDHHNLQVVYYVMENAAYAQGDYEAAWTYAQQALALTEKMQNRWMMAYVLSDLGKIARVQGEYAQAQHYYQASYEIKEAMHDPEGQAAALVQMGKTALLHGELNEAETHYRRSESIYRQIHDPGGLAGAIQGLGEAALHGEAHAMAATHLAEALQIATGMEWMPLTLSILVSAAELLHQVGEETCAVSLLAQVQNHPASDHETRRHAQHLLDELHVSMSPEQFATAVEQGRNGKLDALVAMLQTFLLGMSQHWESARRSRFASTAQPLIEPLTDREMEVLHLIAGGLSNQQIADELIIAVGTVKSYTSQIYAKLGVSSRTQAIVQARELGMI